MGIKQFITTHSLSLFDASRLIDASMFDAVARVLVHDALKPGALTHKVVCLMIKLLRIYV